MCDEATAKPNDPHREVPSRLSPIREETWIALSHEYGSTVLNSFFVLEQVEQLLAKQNPFSAKLTSSEATLSVFRPHLRKCATLLGQLSDMLSQSGADSHQIGRLSEFAARIETYASEESQHFTAEVIRQTIADIILNIKDYTPQTKSDTEVRDEAQKLCRYVRILLCLYAIAETKPRLLKSYRDSVSFRTTATISQETVVTSTTTFDELLKEAVRSVLPFAEQRRIDIRESWGGGNAIISGDLSALSRAMKAILDNAIKYNWQLPKHKGNGWVTIRTSASFQYVEATIENWGTAIEPEEIASGKIFMPRIRGKHAKDQVSEGTGFGLPDAKAVLERDHGGWLKISSRRTRRAELSPGGPHVVTVHIKLPRFG
ncbi:sensor histidine kinase [Paludibaculum fermentans]|uniref:sensor histidine kinase n=1 Tax=Paludibaculum fermentans TaxID=1473598 RepID=UPI003EB9230F